MNSTDQAQKGFKTFVLTLIVSLFVFTALYLVVNSDSLAGKESQVSQANVSDGQVASAQIIKDDTAVPAKASAFEQLSTQQLQVQSKAVLAASTTPGSTESTVPDTGITGPTAAAFVASISISIAAYLILAGPRKLALSYFERHVIDDLK